MATLGPLVVLNRDNSYSWVTIELNKEGSISRFTSGNAENTETAKFPAEPTAGDDFNKDTQLVIQRVIQDFTFANNGDSNPYCLLLIDGRLNRIRIESLTESDKVSYKLYAPEPCVVDNNENITWEEKTDELSEADKATYGFDKDELYIPLFNENLNAARTIFALQWQAEVARLDQEREEQLKQEAFNKLIESVTKIGDLLTDDARITIDGHYEAAIDALPLKKRAELVDELIGTFVDDGSNSLDYAQQLQDISTRTGVPNDGDFNRNSLIAYCANYNLRADILKQCFLQNRLAEQEAQREQQEQVRKEAFNNLVRSVTKIEDLLADTATPVIDGNYEAVINALTPEQREQLVCELARTFVDIDSGEQSYEDRIQDIAAQTSVLNDHDFHKNSLLLYYTNINLRMDIQEQCFLGYQLNLYSKLKNSSLGKVVFAQLEHLQQGSQSLSPYYSGCKDKLDRAVKKLHEILDPALLQENSESNDAAGERITGILADALFNPQNHDLYDVFKEHRLLTVFNQSGVPARSALNISFQYVQNQLTSLKATGQNEAMIVALLEQLKTLQEASETYWPWNYGSQAKLHAIMESIVRMKHPVSSTATAFDKTSLVAAIRDTNSDLYKALNKRGLFTFTEKAAELVAVEEALTTETSASI